MFFFFFFDGRMLLFLSTTWSLVTIDVSKAGVRFAVVGDTSSGSVLVKTKGGKNVRDPLKRLVEDWPNRQESENISIRMREPVKQNYALKYLISFTKASPLSDSVKLFISSDMPLVVQYDIADGGTLSFSLSPLSLLFLLLSDVDRNWRYQVFSGTQDGRSRFLV